MATRASIKAAGLGTLGRPAEGYVPPLSSGQIARRISESGDVGLASVTRNALRSRYTQADFGPGGALRDLTPSAAVGNALSAAYGTGGRGRGGPDSGGQGSPAGSPEALGARPNLGFSGADRMAALAIPGLPGTLAGVVSMADRFFGPIPSVIGGPVAPRPGTQGFRDVVGAGRASRATASLADRGNRSIGGTGL